MANGFPVIIAERKFIEPLEISRSLKVRNFFARETAIVPGKMKIDAVAKIHQIG